MESRQCLVACMRRVAPWGEARVTRILHVWADLLSTYLVPKFHPGVAAVVDSTSAGRRRDPALRCWFIYLQVVHEPGQEPVAEQCVPCECCGALTGRWCDCDDADHAVCGVCEDAGCQCFECPGRTRAGCPTMTRIGDMEIYAFSEAGVCQLEEE